MDRRGEPARPDRRPGALLGRANDRDEAIVRQVAVPTGAGDADVQRALERGAGWDFGFAQVSTDGGATYTSVACTDTTTRSRSRCHCRRQGQRPGLHRLLGRLEAADVQPRGVRGPDGPARLPGVQRPGGRSANGGVPPGFWVDDVMVGSTLVSDGSRLRRLEVASGDAAEHGVRLHRPRRQQRDEEGRVTVKRCKLDRRVRGQGLQLPEVRRQAGRLGRRDRLLRRSVRDEHAVRAVQAHGQRRDAARRR